MIIYMIRHGQTDWNVARKVQGKADIELNKIGREQAREVSKKLKNKKIDIIISSPLKRAKETAQIIAEEIKCPVIYEEGVIERDMGEYEGIGVEEFASISFWNYKKNVKYERAENIRVFFDRIYKFLDKIKEKYNGKNILIVAHGGVSVPVNCYFNGIPENDDLRYLGIHNCEVVEYEVK